MTLAPSHIPGVAGYRLGELFGRLNCLNYGAAWLAAARSRSSLALEMALAGTLPRTELCRL
jgi:hypothetical protein